VKKVSHAVDLVDLDPDVIAIDAIEAFVIESGSDHIGTFGGQYEGGRQIQQVPDEIAACIHAILSSGVKINNYLEIGAAAGGTVYLINHFLHPSTIVIIDDNHHPKAHLRPYILDGIHYEEIIGASQNVWPMVSQTKFDLILIDGDHSYMGAKLDVINYLPFLTDGGYLMLHDSVCQECWGVHLVVEELKQEPGLELVGEYISKKHPRKCGIALFRKASQAAQEGGK